MGRALRAARAVRFAVRCPSAVPASLGPLRRWQQLCGPRTAGQPAGFANTPRRGSLPASSQPPEEAPAPVRNKVEAEGGVVEWDEKRLRIRLAKNPPGSAKKVVTKIWLRDSCPCSLCVDPDSGQKNFSTTDLPYAPSVDHAELLPDGALKVIWAGDLPSGGAPHTSVYPAAEVAEWKPSWQRGSIAAYAVQKLPWDRPAYEALLAEGRCRVSYQDWINNDAAFWAAFADLFQTGLIRVTDVPLEEDAVERVATRIAPLQHTFYGWTWDVKSKPQAENVAYTSQFLGLHQDLMYHKPIPGLQLLHCLANSTEGGESLFSNGIRAAYEVKLTKEAEWGTLKSIKTSFHYQKGVHHYLERAPIVRTDRGDHPRETCWAPPFQATFPLSRDRDDMVKWKQAAHAFQTAAESEDNMVEMKLSPGECVIFDNRQILHGRRQFAAATGDRWLKGTYISQQNFLAAATRLVAYRQSAGLERYPLDNQEEAEKMVWASMVKRTPGLERLTPKNSTTPKNSKTPKKWTTPMKSNESKKSNMPEKPETPAGPGVKA